MTPSRTFPPTPILTRAYRAQRIGLTFVQARDADDVKDGPSRLLTEGVIPIVEAAL
jgi:hypothetical protein